MSVQIRVEQRCDLWLVDHSCWRWPPGAGGIRAEVRHSSSAIKTALKAAWLETGRKYVCEHHRCAGRRHHGARRAGPGHGAQAAAAQRRRSTPTGRPSATRISASGRPGPGRGCATRCARSPSACASSASSAATPSPSSATTGRASTPPLPPCRASAASPVPVYQDSVADEMAYVLEHAEVKFAVVQNQEQVDKVISVADRLPKLQHDHLRRGARARRLRSRQPAFLRARAGPGPRGDARATPAPSGWWLDEIAKGKGSDVSVMLYTSGTTGRPKGVMLTHDNIVVSGAERQQVRQLHARRHAARLPADGLGRRSHLLLRPGLSPAAMCVRLPGEPGDDRRGPPRDRPDLFLRAAARVREPAHPDHGAHGGCGLAQEGACSTISSAWRGAAASRSSTASRSAPRTGCSTGSATCWSTRRCATAWASRRIARGLHGRRGHRPRAVPLLPLARHQPEAALRADRGQRLHHAAARRRGLFRHRRQARARTSRSRSPTAARCCSRAPASSSSTTRTTRPPRETKTPDGWVHTGDAGFFDQRGHLKIIDRAKDVGPPQQRRAVRAEVSREPHQVLSRGARGGGLRPGARLRDDVHQHRPDLGRQLGRAQQRRPMPATRSWPRTRRSTRWSRKRVDELNKALAEEPQMAASQIRRFLILHKELDADDGELTRTQKVRRSFIADRYAPLITALYDGSQGVPRRHRGDLRGRPQGRRRGRRAHRRHADLSLARAAEPHAGGRRMKADVEPKPIVAGAAPSPPATCCCRCENVSLSFGGVKALRDVSFDIRKGEIRAIIGPNGAGKTSMLNVINGFYHPQEGVDHLQGQAAAATCGPTSPPARASPAPSRTSPCSRACRRSTTS